MATEHRVKTIHGFNAMLWIATLLQEQRQRLSSTWSQAITPSR